MEDVVTPEQAKALLSLAPDATKLGDGYNGKARPISAMEEFAGATPVAAARWAASRPPASAERAGAVAWVRGYLAAARAMREKAEVAHGAAKGSLGVDFIHLACRERALAGDSAGSEPPLSHTTHADNCYRNQGGEACMRAAPFFYWRSHSAHLFLHGADSGDFEGGDFFYATDWLGNHKTRVVPKAGRMVTFAAGVENLHGVTPVTRGQRCALSVWFTEDLTKAGHAKELERAEEILRQIPTEQPLEERLHPELLNEEDAGLVGGSEKDSLSWARLGSVASGVMKLFG